jgi:hypothetical protein
LISILVGVILFIILGSVLLGLEDELAGAITIWPLLYLFICIMVGSASIYQSRKFKPAELVIWILVNVIYFVIGLIFFLVQYLDVDYTYDLEKRPQKQVNAAQFVLAYVLFIPTLTAGLICALRVADRGMKDLWKDFKFFIISFGLGVIVMVLCCFLFVHWIDGLIFLGALCFLCYVAVQLWLYIKNDFYVKPVWSLINKTLVVLCVLAAFVISLFDDTLSSYEGGSYSAAVFLFFIWAYSLSNYFIDFVQSD